MLILLFIGTCFVCSIIHVSGSDTREKCITGLSSYGGDSFGGSDGGGFGGIETDEFGGEEGMMELDEGGFSMGDADEVLDGFGGIQPAAGSLSCPAGDRGSILVKRVRYGVSALPGGCHNLPYCEEKFDAGVNMAKTCDGKSKCSVTTLNPKYLNCGRTSNYMLVEYECVDTWATFEICETIGTEVHSASVLITSPGYLGTSKPGKSGVQMCECIIHSTDKADMYLEYLQTQLVSEGRKCPYEYVLIESKKNISQPVNDDQLEVCGQRHVKGRWFAGTLRLTFASGGPMEKRGLLAKFTVDNLGHAPNIQIACGKVNANGLKLQERPRPNESTNSQSNSGSIPATSGFGWTDMSEWGMKFGNNEHFSLPMLPQIPLLHPVLPNTQAVSLSDRKTPAQRSNKSPPNFSKWNIKLRTDENQKQDKPVVNFANTVFKTPSKRKKSTTGPTDSVRPNQPIHQIPTNKKRGTGKVKGNDVDPGANEKTAKEGKSNTGGMVAIVFGGLGSLLIIGSVGTLTLHNYRKRRRNKRKEEMYAYGGNASITYGKGWNTADSVYTTVADVDILHNGCVNPAVVGDNFCTKSLQSGSTENEDTIFGQCSDFGTYDSISLKSLKKDILKPDMEVAVIEVHLSNHDMQGSSKGQQDDGCLYAKAEKFKETNHCINCNIARPPRRKDRNNVYDNNIGITRSRD